MYYVAKTLRTYTKGYRSSDLKARINARRMLAFLRMMVISVQAGQNPLRNPLTASLIANYDGNGAKPWSYAGNIAGPNEILKRLGMDIFADDFETWVLQMVW